MAKNPKYVRLSDSMVHGMVVDMDSGWSISGYDVKEFPEDREEGRFVRQKINAGICEPATGAEYAAAHPEDDEEDDSDAKNFVAAVKEAVKPGSGVQEHVLRKREQSKHSAVKEARLRAKLEEEGLDIEGDEASFEELDYAEDQARREALVEEADDEGLNDDDPEAQRERTATRPAKKAPAKKVAAKKRS